MRNNRIYASEQNRRESSEFYEATSTSFRCMRHFNRTSVFERGYKKVYNKEIKVRVKLGMPDERILVWRAT